MLENLPDLKPVLESCYLSTKTFCKTLMPEVFFNDFSALHDQIFAMIDSGAPRIAIAAPRGFGKTSIIMLGFVARKVLYKDCRFVVYVSNSATSGELQSDNLKYELISNQVIKKLFGPMKVKDAGLEGLDETFSKKSWVAGGHTMIFPRGSGQQVRGILYRSARPDLIIIDDLEDTETIENEEVRLKRENWFFGDLMKCTSRYDKRWQIVYIDTIKHEDCLLQKLIDAPDWESIRLEICDDNLESLAPEVMTTEEIKIEYESHKSKGMLDVFAREFRNLPIDKKTAKFKQEYFKYYDEADLMHPKDGSPPLLTNVVIADPAKTKEDRAADYAIVGWGIDRSSKRMYFRDCKAGKMLPSEFFDKMFDMVVRLNATLLAVEVTSLEDWISQPIKNEMRSRGIPVIYIPIKAQGKKLDRIGMLEPYYEMGYVYHNRATSQGLEQQLSSYPRAKKVDISDAASYIVKVMEEHYIYFDPEGFNPNEPSKDEYEALKALDEKPLKYGRRII